MDRFWHWSLDGAYKMNRPTRSGVDMRRLRYFMAVCDHGGFSRAAHAIGIAQPALTRHVKALEEEIGHPLFARNGRNATPNEIGTFLLDHARIHLDGLNDVVERIRREFSAEGAQVTLGICPTISPLFLTPLEDALRARVPNLSVIEAYSGDLRALMAAGRIDLSLTYFPSEMSGLTVTKLLSERLVLATPAQEVSGPLNLADLARFRLILPSRIHQLRRIIDDVAARRGVSLSPALELDRLASVKEMLADPRGGYATVLPVHSVRADADEGMLTVCPIEDDLMVRDIVLIVPSGRPALPEGLTDLIEAHSQALRYSLGSVV
jgi:LysR family transcriptional regulator, nitrogen assimilation regulatory protein